jgi:thiamine-phosphate pyrophosphorylase
MALRQPLPSLWLMTDERMGDRLWGALHRLPAGSGIVFRHYATRPKARRALFEQVRAIARRRRLILLLAGQPRDAIGWRADGVHGRGLAGYGSAALLRSAPAHDRRELVHAVRGGADLVFLSPVFATRSHPGARALGRTRFRQLAQICPVPVIALGGMDAKYAASLGAYGWAGIDAWTS